MEQLIFATKKLKIKRTKFTLGLNWKWHGIWGGVGLEQNSAGCGPPGRVLHPGLVGYTGASQ